MIVVEDDVEPAVVEDVVSVVVLKGMCVVVVVEVLVVEMLATGIVQFVGKVSGHSHLSELGLNQSLSS